jgi:hypothetical protein
MKNKLVVIAVLFDILISCKSKPFFHYSDNCERNKVLEIAKDTAIKIYGERTIRNEIPLNAELKNDSIWIITGTLKKGYAGGIVYIEILKANNKITKITHYK